MGLEHEETIYLLKEFFWRVNNAKGHSDFFDVSDRELHNELSMRLEGIVR